MTDKIHQARRTAFESKYPLLAGMYWCEETKQYAGNPLFWMYCDRWEAFNAALDCVVIELPAAVVEFHEGDDQHNITLADCRAAIESTNLGIKVE